MSNKTPSELPEKKGIISRILDQIRLLLKKFKESKNKTRIVLSIIFIFLLVWGVLSMAELYLSKLNLKRGFLEVSGRIEGYEYHAGTKVSGKVEEMYVDEGDTVKKGQPIGKIFSKQIDALYKEALANYTLAETKYLRYSKLNEKKAVARIEYDRIETNYRVAKEALIRAEADLSDTTIVAPTDGTVVIKIVRPGEVVAIGTPLVTIVNLDDLFLKIFLATDYAGKVNLGDKAKVFPDALLDRKFDAVVNHIASKAQFTPKNVETKSQRAKLVFEIKLKIKKNKDHFLKPGMPSNGVIKIKKDVSWKKYRR